MTHARPTLDDAAFLAALDHQFDGGRGPDSTLSSAMPTPIGMGPIAAITPIPARNSGRMALGVLAFLMMVGLGAASAALVFQDRVALLLR